MSEENKTSGESSSLKWAIAVFFWVTSAVIASVALNEILHQSKKADILFWSWKKALACSGLFTLAAGFFWASRKVAVPELPKPLTRERAPLLIFLALGIVWFTANLSTPSKVSGDIQFQMLGFRQYLNKDTTQFNAQVVPIVGQDLAKDKVLPMVWYPPAPMWLLLPLTKAGIQLDLAARILIFLGFLCGGTGFLILAKYLGVSHKACLAFSVVLALCMVSRDGFNVVTPTSADCIGWGIFPWLSLATLKLLEEMGKETSVQKKAPSFIALGLATGAIYLVKYSWFVAAATLAFFLTISIFILVRKVPFGHRLALVGLYSICFIAPFFWLNHHYRELSGGDPLDYNKQGGLGENAFVEMVYGPNFSSTARPQELPFSMVAGPGFMLGGNILATKAVQFLRHEASFTHIFQEKLSTNAHVWALILICLPFTVLTYRMVISFLKGLAPTSAVFLITMVVLPIFLLGYLALKSGFNYIVKDNYRYVIPYSLLLQAILLHAWFCKSSLFSSKFGKCVLGLAVFWVCVFPGAWRLQASVLETLSPSAKSVPSIPQNKLNLLISGAEKSIVFFLNGYGPRHIGIVSRESHISFVLDGGLPKGPSFVASSPTRVVVAVESNLDPNRQDIQSFLKRFLIMDWQVTEAPGSLYPMILSGNMSDKSSSN